MTYDSSSIRKLRDAMFAFDFAHPVVRVAGKMATTTWHDELAFR